MNFVPALARSVLSHATAAITLPVGTLELRWWISTVYAGTSFTQEYFSLATKGGRPG